MRNFQTLDKVVIDDETGIIYFSVQGDSDMSPRLTLRREGGYVAISASYGPLEIALRPQFDNLTSKLGRLQPVKGLQTTRQVGTTEAYLGLGLREDGTLLLRPTIVADATGHFSFNLMLTSAARETLYAWLPITPVGSDANDNAE